MRIPAERALEPPAFMPASALGPPALRSVAAEVRRLQAGAGNAAVARLVARQRASRRRLSRYEPGEHTQFGPGGMVTLAGVKVPARFLVAMGDLYETPEKLMKAKADEIKQLVAMIELDEQKWLGKLPKDAKPPGEEDWQKWSEKWRPAETKLSKGERYMDLNKRNLAHFAPANKGRWEELHKQALDLARKQGKGTGVVPEEARIVNLFAAHFLSDAFSAGHLIDKPMVMDIAGRQYRRMGADMKFSLAVATGVLADKTVQAKLKGKELKSSPVGGDWGAPTPDRFAGLLRLIATFKTSDFLNIFARVVHDQLNQSIKSGKPIWVENDAGDRWKLSGDETLAKSGETLRIGTKAVEASQQNLLDAARSAGSVDYDKMFKNVWRYVPRPTVKAAAGEDGPGRDRFNQIWWKFTDAVDPDTIAAVVQLSISQFDTALSQLKEQGLVRDAPPAKAGSK